MKLIYDDTGKPVQVGDEVVDFRDDPVTVIGMQEPRHSGSTGRVGLRSPDGWEHYYYPSVIGASWSDEE